MFKPKQMYEIYGDPEGPLSTIPAFATAILGALTGTWLRSGRTQKEKTLGLVFSGVAFIALGYLWSPWFPIIKKTWTSSFVLVAGGWSLLFLALFYYLIDVRGWTRWSLFFVVIGLNAITIYVGQNIIDFEGIAGFFVSGVLKYIPVYKDILFAICVLAVKWLFLRFLHRQRIYLRV
jgi:predicted acyltransferase